ncbi:uncharacterized protein LOC127283055 [Leptopilina boulardi]|uniref:uncharacterized protein LOC127283055 n=1 Tax=Leptopilina boulardi TaxID=63433 RepID=UPI0021F5B5B4|nr:uncharacterized protein LOC127283055 [Leptopilina boulardi]
MRENNMQRLETANNDEEEEEDDDDDEDDDRSSDHLVNSGLICAACHVTVSSTILRDNNINYEQALACSHGHFLCQRCVQRFAIRPDIGCLICATESQNSTYSQNNNNNNSYESSLDNIQSKSSVQYLQQKRKEEICPRTHYPPTSSIIKIPCNNNIKINSIFEWGTDHGDTIYDAKNPRKSYCNIIKREESNADLKITCHMIAECSRRPIRCPRLDCARTVALSALTHHFLFDHPEVPIFNVEPGVNNTLIVSFSSLTYGSSKCLALLLVSGKVSGAAATLFSGNQVHPKYRNRLPLPVLAARLKIIDQLNCQDETKAGGEGRACGDIIIAWIAGLDLSGSSSGALRCSIQAVDGLQSEVFRSLTYCGPINSLRRAQRPQDIFAAGDCVVLHEGLINQLSSRCDNFIVNAIVH